MSEQSTSSNGDRTFDINELLEIRTRCRELRKERESLRDSQKQSLELIRNLEKHVQTLTCAHIEDKKRIQELERELDNCSQEIDYLQDQLSLSNSELNMLGEEVCYLQLKLKDKEMLEEEREQLKEELEMANAEHVTLLQRLENKELELHSSALLIEKLEESISSVGLEYQCEIESLKLDMATLEQNIFELRKSQESEHLEKENAKLNEQLQNCENNVKVFCQILEEQCPELIVLGHEVEQPGLDNNVSSCGDILGPLLTKLAILGASSVDFKDKTNTLPSELQKYESLVEKLKEELKSERLKAKEEAEDLAQEMAELRYHMTGLLEEEQKRRACVEQLSLQRISELEAQLEKERNKSFVHGEEVGKAITISRYTPRE